MKRLTLIIALLAAGIMALRAQTAEIAAPPFVYPSVPDSITGLQERHDFFVSHFWDRIDLKKAFSSKPNMVRAFSDFVSPMRLATADTVHSAIARFMHRLDKQPVDQLYIAGLAELAFYADSASLPSDELFVSFINPVVVNKRVDKAYKARYDMLLNQLNRSMTGRHMPAIHFVDREGRNVTFTPAKGQPVIIYFFDPDCSDCRLAKVRLMADPWISKHTAEGGIALVALSASEPTDEWRRAVATLPETWLVGTDPELDINLDLRAGIPSFYLIDEEGRLVAKHLSIDSLLNIISRL